MRLPLLRPHLYSLPQRRTGEAVRDPHLRLPAKNHRTPGRLSPAPHHRRETINGHRKAMCAKVHNPEPKKYDCAEYPFAASKEGGNPSRGSTRIISAAGNRSVGARLGGFYKSQRVLNGDAYYVHIK
nr:NucA/NucB deoxyribonuclease domain-containing protein [Streptomyces sp. SID685]